jgi:hypothetical protein
MSVDMILWYFISNSLIYSEFTRIYTNTFIFFENMLTAGLLHTAALVDSCTLPRAPPDTSTLPHKLPHCRTQPCALPHKAAYCMKSDAGHPCTAYCTSHTVAKRNLHESK